MNKNSFYASHTVEQKLKMMKMTNRPFDRPSQSKKKKKKKGTNKKVYTPSTQPIRSLTQYRALKFYPITRSCRKIFIEFAIQPKSFGKCECVRVLIMSSHWNFNTKKSCSPNRGLKQWVFSWEKCDVGLTHRMRKSKKERASDREGEREMWWKYIYFMYTLEWNAQVIIFVIKRWYATAMLHVANNNMNDLYKKTCYHRWHDDTKERIESATEAEIVATLGKNKQYSFWQYQFIEVK